MKLFELNIASLMLRFYLLMAIVIVSFFIGLPWLSILALPVFLSAMMGARFSTNKKAKQAAEHILMSGSLQAIGHKKAA